MDKPLEKLDHIMWDAEAPNSQATIAGIMTFRKPIHKDRMIAIIEKRLMRYERFQNRVIIKNGNPVWHPDENFQLLSHIHHLALPGRGRYQELQACISDIISQPLNYNKPLWDIHLIDNYKGGSAILWRVHHAIGDGMAWVRVVFSLTGISAADSLAVFGEEADDTPVKVKDEIEYLVDVGVSAFEGARYLLNHPSILRQTAQSNWDLVKEIAGMALGTSSAASIYKGDLGMSKKAAWTGPHPLSDFKLLSRKYDAKINDVMLAMMAGALRKHLMAHGQKLTEGIRIVMPVNIRKTHEAKSLQNEFSFITLDLPVHMTNFEKRVAFIKERTAHLKPSANSLLMTQLIHIAADYTPLTVKQKLMELMGKAVAGVITNVPGPTHPIYLAGGKVEDLMFWIPHTVPLGVGMSLMSYNGKVYMGLVTDDVLIKDPDLIVRAFASELKRALKA